jgi:pimeloyl-ACP methyl ester carboxylesterase
MNRYHIATLLLLLSIFSCSNFSNSRDTTMSDISTKTNNNTLYFPFKGLEQKNEYMEHYQKIEADWPVEYENVIVATSYGPTFVKICGPKDAPAIVLLPGDTENSLSWKNQIEALSKEYRTYLPDQINDYGLSIRSRKITCSNDFVLWLDELFTNLNLHKLNLCGFSYGGGLAIGYTLAHPERINKLVIYAPACRNFPISTKVLFSLIIQDTFRTRKIITKYIYWERQDAVKKDEMTKQVVDELIDELMLSRKCFIAHNWIMPFPVKKNDWANIHVPCLFIVGKNDILVLADKVIPFLNRVAPQIQTEIVPDAGHDLLLVKSEEIIDKTLIFIKQ